MLGKPPRPLACGPCARALAVVLQAGTPPQIRGLAAYTRILLADGCGSEYKYDILFYFLFLKKYILKSKLSLVLDLFYNSGLGSICFFF